jgi:predicted Rossmann fold nucleotide-binding protein DprA/Smf involved in DNA uptake
LLLTNRLIESDVEPLKSAEYWALIETVDDPSRLLGQTSSAIAAMLSCPPREADRLTTLIDRATALAFELERRSQSGLELLSPFDDAYPARLQERLGRLAPPVLCVVGNTALLTPPGIGVVGSRAVTEELAEVAREAARVAVRSHLSVVSGAARGIDQAAMGAAFESEGGVVGVVADSLLKQAAIPDVRRAVAEDLVCLLTPYKPDAPFNAGNAMGRNKLIYALARITLVVTSDLEKGGTWAGATEAIRRGFGAVAVWRGPGVGAGNAALAKRGAAEVVDVAELLDLDIGPSAGRRDTQLPLEL